MGWLRSFIRKRMKPMPKAQAMKAKSRLSFLYFFSAWNVLILAIIYTVKYTFPPTEADSKYPAKYYAKVLGTGDARVIRFSGLTKVGEYEITGTKRETGRTKEEREAARQKWQEFNAKMEARRRRQYLDLPELVEDEEELLNEGRMRTESDAEDREDLNLLIEQTSSL